MDQGFILIYLSISVGCALFYSLSLLLGGDHDIHHHGDLGHHDGYAGDHDGSVGFKDFLSIRSILLFGTGFGSMSALSLYLGVFGFLVPILGIATGFFLSYIGIKLIRFLMKQEGNTENTLIDLEGSIGKVNIIIPEGMVGEILIHDYRGQAHYLRARSHDGKAIVGGKDIEVVSVVGGEVLVKPIERLPLFS